MNNCQNVWGRCRGVVVNFDLGERSPKPRSQQRGSLRPRARRVAVLGVGAGAPFRFQNICRNGVPPRSRTTTPLGRCHHVLWPILKRMPITNIPSPTPLFFSILLHLKFSNEPWGQTTRSPRSSTVLSEKNYSQMQKLTETK